MTGPDRLTERIALPAILRTGAPAAVLAALPGARAVGGAVRDTLAGLPVQDVDVAAPFPPEEISARLRSAGLKVFDTGLAHGTVTAVQDHQPVEVTALRRDVATDGRHAEVEWTTDWREDAARRDFTINAMSLAPDGGLFDYFGGREDLKRGVVRFVGDPATRLREDYLRILRFFRFHTRYGRGMPDPAAVAAIREAVPGLARLSVERVWSELKRILSARDAGPACTLMEQTGVLPAVLPGTTAAGLRALPPDAPADPILRLVALHMPDGRAALAALPRALKLSTGEARAIDATAGAHLPEDSQAILGVKLWMTDRAIADSLYRLSRRFGAEESRAALLRRSWLAQAFGPEDDPRPREYVRHRVAQAPVPAFPLLGRDAMDAGMPPGPRIGRLLAEVESWWVAQGFVPDRESCLAELRRRIAEAEKNGGADLGGEGRG